MPMLRWIWLCLVGFGYVSFEPMRDYAGFGYASLDLVMYPMDLCEIMRDMVMPRCCFGYVSFVFVVSVMFL